MPFIDTTLRGNEPFTLDVTPEVLNSGPIAVTVTYLNSTGNRIRDIDIFTVPQGDPQGSINRAIPRNTSRIYIEIDMPRNGLAQARVTQGGNVHTSDIAFDTRLVFDVV